MTECALKSLMCFNVIVKTLCANDSFVTNLASKNFLTVDLVVKTKFLTTSKTFPTSGAKKSHG